MSANFDKDSINNLPSAGISNYPEVNNNNNNHNDLSSQNHDDIELGTYREYQTFKKLHNMFNGNSNSNYAKNSQMVNNALSNLSLPRISVEPFPLMANPASSYWFMWFCFNNICFICL